MAVKTNRGTQGGGGWSGGSDLLGHGAHLTLFSYCLRVLTMGERHKAASAHLTHCLRPTVCLPREHFLLRHHRVPPPGLAKCGFNTPRQADRQTDRLVKAAARCPLLEPYEHRVSVTPVYGSSHQLHVLRRLKPYNMTKLRDSFTHSLTHAFTHLLRSQLLPATARSGDSRRREPTEQRRRRQGKRKHRRRSLDDRLVGLR